MKRKKILIPALLIAAAVAGGLVYHFQFQVDQKAEDALTLYGAVDIRQVELAFFATGRIKRLMVQEGDRVQAGQLLAEINPSRYEAALDKAEANLRAAREELAILRTGTRPEDIKRARAAKEAARARLEDARISYKRVKKLYETDAVPKQRLDDAEMMYRTARADLDQARQALALALEGPRDEEIAAARAQVEAARAAVRLAETELADASIHAPDNGVIQKRILQVGDMAFPQTPVFTLALVNPVWVRAYLPEPRLGRIQPGYKATIFTDSYPDKAYEGWVGYISPTAEFTPKQVQTEALRTKLVYQVRVFACNPQGELRLGMPATIRIPLNQPAPPAGRTNTRPCEDQ